MNLKKLAPWNWFSRENAGEGRAVPVNISRSGPGRFEDEIDWLFDTVLDGFKRPLLGRNSSILEGLSNSPFKPRLDLAETGQQYTVSVEIPGVTQKDVRLEVTNDTLTISGEKKQETEEKNKNYYRVERSYGSFQRVLSLPHDADQDNINARFKKGVLTITIPRKKLSGPRAKQIQINHV